MNRLRIIISGLVFLLLCVFFVVTCLLGLRNNPLYGLSLILALLVVVIIFQMPGADQFIPKQLIGEPAYLILLALATLTLRLLWLHSFDITPVSDYKLYHELAIDLSRGTLNSGTYVALFPHIISYPAILSLVYKYFGAHILNAQILNACLGVGIVWGIYWLGSRLFTPGFGLLSGIIIALWPSQVMFTSVIASEILFTFMLVGCMSYLLLISNTKKLLQSTIYFAGLGITTAVMNAIRPIGFLFLISFITYYLIFAPPIISGNQSDTSRSSWVNKFLLVVCVCVLYFLSNAVIHRALEEKLGLNVAKSFIGYSLLVGSNFESGGMWNQGDANLQLDIYQVGKVHPDLVDQELLKRAVQRITSAPLLFVKLQSKKNYAMWQNDQYGIDWHQWDLKRSFIYSLTPRFWQTFYSTSNYYYFTILFLCILGGVLALLNRELGFMTFIALMLAGMVTTFIFTEVQSRYHYPAVPLLTLMACYGLYHLRRRLPRISRLVSHGTGQDIFLQV